MGFLNDKRVQATIQIVSHVVPWILIRQSGGSVS